MTGSALGSEVRVKNGSKPVTMIRHIANTASVPNNQNRRDPRLRRKAELTGQGAAAGAATLRVEVLQDTKLLSIVAGGALSPKSNFAWLHAAYELAGMGLSSARFA